MNSKDFILEESVKSPVKKIYLKILLKKPILYY